MRELFAEEVEAINSYATERGLKWKADLELDWYNARLSYCDEMPARGTILHGLRNDPHFGPEGLRALKLKQFKIVNKGKAKKFATLDAAKKVAGEIFRKTGIIVGIEEVA